MYIGHWALSIFKGRAPKKIWKFLMTYLVVYKALQKQYAAHLKGLVKLRNWMNFGNVPFSIKKFILQISGTLNRAFWAWNWYKILTWTTMYHRMSTMHLIVCIEYHHTLLHHASKHWHWPLEYIHLIVYVKHHHTSQSEHNASQCWYRTPPWISLLTLTTAIYLQLHTP